MPSDVATEGVLRVERLGEAHVHDVFGVVLRRRQLLEDDLALGLDVVRTERRRGRTSSSRASVSARSRAGTRA